MLFDRRKHDVTISHPEEVIAWKANLTNQGFIPSWREKHNLNVNFSGFQQAPSPASSLQQVLIKSFLLLIFLFLNSSREFSLSLPNLEKGVREISGRKDLSFPLFSVGKNPQGCSLDNNPDSDSEQADNLECIFHGEYCCYGGGGAHTGEVENSANRVPRTIYI